MENTKVTEAETMERPDYESEIIKIIRGKLSPKSAQKLLEDYHANDIAGVLENLTPSERRALYHILGAEETSEVFAYLDDASTYIAELPTEIAADIVQEMDADDAVDVLEDLDEAQQAAIIQEIDDEEAREDIRLIQSYEDDEIGSKMTTNYISIQRGLTIKQAMRALVEQAADNDNLSTIYVYEETEPVVSKIKLFGTSKVAGVANGTSMEKVKEEISEGSRLKYEMFEYEIIG